MKLMQGQVCWVLCTVEMSILVIYFIKDGSSQLHNFTIKTELFQSDRKFYEIKPEKGLNISVIYVFCCSTCYIQNWFLVRIVFFSFDHFICLIFNTRKTSCWDSWLRKCTKLLFIEGQGIPFSRHLYKT